MRIYHFITGLGTGGAEMMLYKIACELGFQGHISEVICLGISAPTMVARFEEAGIRVHFLGLKGFASLPKALMKAIAILRRDRPDIVQGWMYHGNLMATLAHIWARSRARLYWGIRQTLYAIRNERRGTAIVIHGLGLLSRFPVKIVYNSALSAEQHGRIGYPSGKALIIPNGFSLSKYIPLSVEAKAAARRRLGLPESGICIGMIARSHPMKDHAGFVEAAALVKKRFPDAHFLMTGKGVEDPVNPYIIRIGELNLRDGFTILGERSDVCDWIGCLDIVICSSAWGEGFPNILGEAMASGVPCVTTSVGDAAYVVGECGLVVEPRNPAALAAAISKMILAGPQARHEIGIRGRERINANFSIEEIAARFATAYAGEDTRRLACVG